MDTVAAPRLREDLNLLTAQPAADGTPAWLLHDPFSGRYFRLGALQVEMLSHIGLGDAARVAAETSEQTHQTVAVEQVIRLFEFLRHNNLVEGDTEQQHFFEQQRNQRPGWFNYLAKSYLFIRIPLVNPDAFLQHTLPYVRWLGHPATWWALFIFLLAGLSLTLRQVDSFVATFMHLFNAQGLIVFAVALFFVKILHELGHAYVAKAYGCRVPVIGLALLVLWPVLYTDTTDAWRLTDRQQRLRIAMAGMAVEMTVAIVALLAWSLVPDGVVRSVLFVLATTTWMMSLMINVNPLMRFDGYYLLSDWLSIPNLESRSQALARWWLREKLFNFNMPAPEPVNKGMIAFAVAVWCYRFLLFIGIALLVFHLVFKALGIILFIAEIGYFILAPIYREIKMWHTLKQHFQFNLATFRTAVIVLAVTGLFFIPWQGVVEAPALLSYYNQSVYAPLSGQVQTVSVMNDSTVKKDDPLLWINSPGLEHDLQQSKIRYDELQQQRFAAGLTAANLDQTLVAATALVSQNRRMRSLSAKLQRQQIKAPFTGKVLDTRVDLQPGMWIKEGEPLFVIVDPDRFTLIAYVAEADLGRINAGDAGVFYPDGGGIDPIPVSIKEIEVLGIRELSEPGLASLFGGGVAVRENEDGQMIPVRATYRLHLQLAGELNLLQRELTGVINLDSAAQSLAKRVYRRFMAILIRESDF